MKKDKNSLFYEYIRKYGLLLIIFIFALISKLYQVHFILGITFTFYSIFLILMVRLYGLRLAVVSAVVIQGISFYIFKDPLWNVTSIFEMIFIGLVTLRRSKTNMVLWDILFWIIIGIPVSIFIYRFGYNQAFGNSFFFAISKDMNNGVLNCLLADVLLAYIPFNKFMMSKNDENNYIVYFNQIFLQLTFFIVIIPFFLSFIVTSLNIYESMTASSKQLGISASDGICRELLKWDNKDIDKLNIMGVVQIGYLNEIIQRETDESMFKIIVANYSDEILTTNDSTLKQREVIKINKAKGIERISDNFYKVLPKENSHDYKIDQWAKGSFIYERLIDQYNIKIYIKFPLKQYQDRVFMNYFEQTQLLIYAVLCAIIFSLFLNKFLVKTINQLCAVTTGLPDKLRRKNNIEWPSSTVSEVKILVENFKQMSNKVEHMFYESHNLNEELKIKTEMLESSEEKLHYLAYYDSLTGLPNRLFFNHYLMEELSNNDYENSSIAIMFIDVNKFKQVNDTMGHSAGDELLQIIGKRLQGLKDESTEVFRLSGDEFVLITKSHNQAEIKETGCKLMDKFTQPVKIHNTLLTASASIGVSISPKDSDDMDTLIKCADMAMYTAKEKGGTNIQYYSE